MKNKGLIIFLITFLSIIVIGLTFFFILLLNGKINFKNIGLFSKKSTTVIAEKVYENTSVNSISIDSDVTDITIKKSNTNDLKVVVYGDKSKDKVDVDSSSNKLDIKYKGKKCYFLCINKKLGSIEVYVPDGYGKDITIKNDVGDINLENSIASLNIRNDVGDIKVKSIGRYVKIRNDVGDIKISSLNITEDSSIENDIGDIEIENAIHVNIDAKTDVGEKNINDNDKKSDVTLKLRNDVGDIDVN